MRIAVSRQQFGQVQPNGVLTIGNFDGVHVGHQEILKVACETARRLSKSATVMTFEPHPAAVLHPEKAPKVLTPLELKVHLLREHAEACIIVLKDCKDLLSLTAEDFVDRFLMRAIKPSMIVEGEDFNFGAGRSGTIETLRHLGLKKGFEVKVAPSRQVRLATGQAIRVSSTMIRYMLESGHVADAAFAMGRPFRLYGKIIPGKGKGRQIGFPTLNMERPDQILPAEGVYAGLVEIADNLQDLFKRADHRRAVFSLGQARTFGEDHPLLIEAHLLSGPPGDVTGKWMAMDFVERVRSQHKFSTVEELASQIGRDCLQARGILERSGAAQGPFILS